MKLYKDMNDKEQAASDKDHQCQLFYTKLNAECEMEDWDSLSPERRAYERLMSQQKFDKGELDPYLVEDLYD